MSFKEKTFKEKKTFYKERQKFFEAVKSVDEGNEEVIKFNGEQYKLLPVSWEYIYKHRYGKCVIFSKAFKSNTLVDWWYSDKRGFKHDSEHGNLCHSPKNVLCLAEKIY